MTCMDPRVQALFANDNAGWATRDEPKLADAGGSILDTIRGNFRDPIWGTMHGPPKGGAQAGPERYPEWIPPWSKLRFVPSPRNVENVFQHSPQKGTPNVAQNSPQNGIPQTSRIGFGPGDPAGNVVRIPHLKM